MLNPALAPEFLAPPAPSRSLVNSVSLPLTGALALAGYLLLVPPAPVQSRSIQTIDLSLRGAVFEVMIPSPALPNATLTGEGGGSNHQGDGSRDPSLAVTPSAAQVSTLSPEVDAPATVKDLDLALPTPGRLVDPGLPVQAGGNGVSQGQGNGFGRGLGDGLGNGVGRGAPNAAREVRLDQLTVLRQSIPRYVYAKGEVFSDTVVIIQASLDLDGIPRELKPLRGESKLIEVAMKSVKDWRFHIPDHLKSEVPLQLKLRFNFLKL